MGTAEMRRLSAALQAVLCLACLTACHSLVPFRVRDQDTLEAGTASAKRTGGTFVVHNDSFVRDGKQIQIVSAELHYFRIPRALWRDRIERVAAMGFNAIQVYVPWNFHEESKGSINFAGDRDLGRFLHMAQEANLLVLLRPGPYICAEWEFGGFPAWLLAEDGLKLRTYEERYIAHVDEWFGTLLPIVENYLYSKGGPVVMVQVENEFGSYGHADTNQNDKLYLVYLVALLRRHLGNDIILYTTDFGNLGAMLRGSINGSAVLTAGDFGPGYDFNKSAAAQKQMNPPGLSPPFCSEFYSGWWTGWGTAHMANKTGAQAEQDLAHMLALGFSVNVYMGHGGTNFGFWGGANTVKDGDPESFVAMVTSYDYSAPVTEWGAHSLGPDGNDKFNGMRAVIRAHTRVQPPPEPARTPSAAYGDVLLPWHASLWDTLSVLGGTPVHAAAPLPFEKVGAAYGFVLYRSAGVALGPDPETSVLVSQLRDRAHVFLDRRLCGVLMRGEHGSSGTHVAVPEELRGKRVVLELLVESLGRVNYGPYMTDPKGITHSVSLGGKRVTGPWTMTPVSLSHIPLQALDALSPTPSLQPASSSSAAASSSASASSAARDRASFEATPTLYRGTLHIARGGVRDTFLSTRGWGKGYVWVNGHNLGMYWETAGPQHALYLPACLLRDGLNEVTVFELDRGGLLVGPRVRSTDAPDYDSE